MTHTHVEQLKSKRITWDDLVRQGVIEYIDPEEQAFSLIAMSGKDKMKDSSTTNPRYTYCEIHPVTMLGAIAACIPYVGHNPAPRNTYQCAMGKQAMGYPFRVKWRTDKTFYEQFYRSVPLVRTFASDMFGFDRAPAGCMATIAILTYSEYNQEDSTLANKGSMDRGLFCTTLYHTEKDEDSSNSKRDEFIRQKPDPKVTTKMAMANYEKLQPDGLMAENTLIENRDIIIGKVVSIKENRNDPSQPIKFIDRSVMMRTTEPMRVDRTYCGKNEEGIVNTKVVTRTFRKAEIGDKYSSRQAQKGTIGYQVPEEQMPYMHNGQRPDLIINPHAIPSRMTIATLKEILYGPLLAHLGVFGDGTINSPMNIADICAALTKLGFQSFGDNVMYDGNTGEMMECMVFTGPCYYQRLKHMVSDKIHSRAMGPKVNLTRQPQEGRSRDGGFRIGEMERDVIIAHGASEFMHERLFEVSDAYSVHICRKCGLIACYNDGKTVVTKKQGPVKIHECRSCGNLTDFSYVETPYAMKLLIQELMTINIVPRFIVE